MDINIQTNAPEIGRYMGTVARKQIPFATSKAINETAKSIKATEQGKLGNYFDMRTGWLEKSGALPIKPSRKSQAPFIHATLRVRDEVASLAATGGTHEAAGRAMAVPFSNVGDGLSTRDVLNPARQTLPRSKWPSKILNKGDGKRSKGRRRKVPKPFVMQTSSGQFVVKRKSKTDESIQFLYAFQPRVYIDKRWPLVENARKNVDRNFDRRFRVELRKALMTAK